MGRGIWNVERFVRTSMDVKILKTLEKSKGQPPPNLRGAHLSLVSRDIRRMLREGMD